MNQDEIKAVFDRQAENYDGQWGKTAAIREALFFLLEAVFSGLPAQAHVLCVGAGTGEEIAYLARRFPGWRFTAAEPSGAMLDVCRRKADEEGFLARCSFHEGYVEALPREAGFDAATCFLVSHFLLDQETRATLFRDIAVRLRPGGMLASSDLASDAVSGEYEALLGVWMNMLATAGIPAEGLARMRDAYARDVAILPPARVAALIQSAGFDAPVAFYQAGLIHAWFAKRAGT
ncbi:class I SAM-dependent methyltransferase [Betaproteobacteria bacterium SCN1]|jgi:tRNA (cmo5U34)-methyltransferase|nr:class I SAM-dependent methyltransferase [Betaproteobacteria bacterium SCN1]MBN8759258.1 class I SAM-dependent methyltransferase [Thiobacillus sp.]ODU90211.1 MAG: SAM-dependent methyltransferase [Thiobacillus sp. SCN 65-179]OJW38352.1 MAG: SAM-dependent methyltransferase [Thiobacillus sp. 65-69]